MTEESTAKIEKFSGEKQDWTLWSEMYLARLEVKGIGDILLMDPKDIPKAPSSVTKEEKVRKNNLKAYSDLITCMDIKKPQGKAAMRLIVASKSSDYPRGNAPQAWKNLLRKFAPTTMGELNRTT